MQLCAIVGRSHPEFGHELAKKAGLGEISYDLTVFTNTEMEVKLKDPVRGKDIVIIETAFGKKGEFSINDIWCEIQLFCDACNRSSCKSISLITPLMPYERSDKKTGRTSIGAFAFLNQLNVSGVGRVIAMDLHAAQIQGFFGSKPLDNLYALDFLAHAIVDLEHPENYVVVAPDRGATKRAEAFAKKYKVGIAYFSKERKGQGEIGSMVLHSDGTNFKGKKTILLDDMIDTGGTMISAAEALRTYEPAKVIVAATHGVFSRGTAKLVDCPAIDEIYVTNTLPVPQHPKIHIVDVTPLFAEVLRRLKTDESISEIFDSPGVDFWKKVNDSPWRYVVDELPPLEEPRFRISIPPAMFWQNLHDLRARMKTNDTVKVEYNEHVNEAMQKSPLAINTDGPTPDEFKKTEEQNITKADGPTPDYWKPDEKDIVQMLNIQEAKQSNDLQQSTIPKQAETADPLTNAPPSVKQNTATRKYRCFYEIDDYGHLLCRFYEIDSSHWCSFKIDWVGRFDNRMQVYLEKMKAFKLNHLNHPIEWLSNARIGGPMLVWVEDVEVDV